MPDVHMCALHDEGEQSEFSFSFQIYLLMTVPQNWTI